MIGPGDVGWYSDDGDHDRDEDDDDNNNEDNQMSRVELKTKSELVQKRNTYLTISTWQNGER